MGLFSRKLKISVDDVAMDLMLAASEAIGRLEPFGGVEEMQSMAVNMGYFYGFVKLHFNGIISANIANTVLEKSFIHLENATKGKSTLNNCSQTIKRIANSTIENMKYAAKESKNPFLGMVVFYMNDMYGSYTINVDLMDLAEQNIRRLYGMASAFANKLKELDVVVKPSAEPRKQSTPAAACVPMASPAEKAAKLPSDTSATITCSNCKSEISAKSKFCQFCGHQQPLPSKQILFCRECGNKLEPHYLFCNICGTKVPRDSNEK